jgi:pyruvate/2-oxoglutarate dehydrogenase complex dihydrolipoamide acyltransferase (E2) component
LPARLRTSRWIAALAIGGGAVAPIGLAPGTACAGAGERAALVIDTGTTDIRLCVELNDQSVTGLELIELAGEQHGLEYHLGFGGQAVCMLAGVGPTGDDCFEQYPDYWGYWRGDDGGGWSWSSTGAGTTEVEDGDVEGWAWGSGDGGDSHPQPPATDFADVCKTAPAPSDESPEVDSTPAPRPGRPSPAAEPSARPSAGTGATAAGRAPRGTESRGRDRRWHEGGLAAELAPPSATPTPSPTARTQPPAGELAAETGSSNEDGPPAVGVAGLVGAFLLVAAGAFVTVRRRR